jgi:hypothetical protein
LQVAVKVAFQFGPPRDLLVHSKSTDSAGSAGFFLQCSLVSRRENLLKPSRMCPGKFHLLRVAGLLLGAATCLCAGNFAPPAEGPVAFRRDRVPLNAEAMTDLSRQLATLAEGLDFKSAASRRGAAQILALSAALDPANGKARELITQFQNNEYPTAVDPGEIAKSRARISPFLTWLETPEAGSQGKALAACLTDVMHISDPEHPRAEALRAAGERGAWQGWIPELAAYQPEPELAVKPTPTEEPPPAKPGILLGKAQVFTLLWKNVGKDESVKWILSRAPLQMAAGINPARESEPFSVTIGPWHNDLRLSQLSTLLLKLLQKQHDTLPAGGRVTITSDALEMSLRSNKRQTISAAAAVLASSAISGRKPDATIIGMIDEAGAFKLPRGFWEQLQSLSPGNGGRLVLPAAAADYLPAMLALEKPGFFLEYEVLLAANFQELLDLTEKTPRENLAKASAQFLEIREKADTQSIGQYLSNSFVRRRLAEISQNATYHYSAKMLALQGAGNRPAFISRSVLASELRRAIEPIGGIAKQEYYKLKMIPLNQFGAIQNGCRDELSRLFRVADKNDRELLDHVQEMIPALRTLERSLKTREEWASESVSAYSTLVRIHAEVTEELAIAVGDSEATAP